MADEQATDVGGQTSIVERTAGGDGPINIRDAANSLIDGRRKDNAQEQDGEARQDATADESVSQEAGAAPPQEVTGETQEAEPAEPAIDPPRSWKKDAREHWNKLDRATQEYLVSRDSEDQAAIKRSLNEAAEKLKGLTAEQQAVQQARTHYEQMLPALLQEMQNQQSGAFADIKSLDDVTRLAQEDWPRFCLFQAHQMKVGGMQREVEASQQRQAQEKATRLTAFVNEQNALFDEKAPELSDPKAKAAAAETAGVILKDLGYSREELGDLWRGESEISLHDHRLQLLLRDAVKYREAQTAKKTAVVRPVPPVQRPGAARPAGADADERVKALDSRLTQSGNVKDATALLMAQRSARR